MPALVPAIRLDASNGKGSWDGLYAAVKIEVCVAPLPTASASRRRALHLHAQVSSCAGSAPSTLPGAASDPSRECPAPNPHPPPPPPPPPCCSRPPRPAHSKHSHSPRQRRGDILDDVKQELYGEFKAAHPAVTLSFSEYT